MQSLRHSTPYCNPYILITMPPPPCLLHPIYSTLSTAYCLPLMLDGGVSGLPARRPVEVPPSSWIEDMRTPAADLILMEFHRQKYSTEGEADGQENTSPNSAFHTDPAPQPDSPISGLLLALCFCPSACGLLHFCKQCQAEAICIALHDMQLSTDSSRWNPLYMPAVKDVITLRSNMSPVFCTVVMPVSNLSLRCTYSTADRIKLCFLSPRCLSLQVTRVIALQVSMHPAAMLHYTPVLNM